MEGAWLENVSSSGVRQQCKPGLLWLPPQSDPGLAWGTSVGTCQARTRSAGVSRPAAGAHGAHARSADTPLVPAARSRAACGGAFGDVAVSSSQFGTRSPELGQRAVELGN